MLSGKDRTMPLYQVRALTPEGTKIFFHACEIKDARDEASRLQSTGHVVVGIYNLLTGATVTNADPLEKKSPNA